MDRKNINKERVVCAVGFLFLIIASITGFLFDGDPYSIIEKVHLDSSIVIPWTHVFCATLALLLIFKPNDTGIIIVLTIESMLLVLTDYAQLGIFFFWDTIIVIYCKDLYKFNRKTVTIILAFLHILALLGSSTHSWKCAFISIGNSIFCAAFYFWIYTILKAKLSCYLPYHISNNQTIEKKPGDILDLNDYNLTERQISFVLENLHNNLSYKKISDKYFVSISTVKKTFAEVYKIFNVNKLDELRYLLLQYQVKA